MSENTYTGDTVDSQAVINQLTQQLAQQSLTIAVQSARADQASIAAAEAQGKAHGVDARVEAAEARATAAEARADAAEARLRVLTENRQAMHELGRSAAPASESV